MKNHDKDKKMSSHTYPYHRVKKFCLNCKDQIPGRGGLFCWKDECQEARMARKRANERAWNQKHKPWLQRNADQLSPNRKPKPQPKVIRYCQYKYCKRKRVPLPEGYYRFHPDCHIRVTENLGHGIDSAYGETI